MFHICGSLRVSVFVLVSVSWGLWCLNHLLRGRLEVCLDKVKKTTAKTVYEQSCSTSAPKRSWSVKIDRIGNVTVKKTFAGTDQTTWNRVKLSTPHHLNKKKKLAKHRRRNCNFCLTINLIQISIIIGDGGSRSWLVISREPRLTSRPYLSLLFLRTLFFSHADIKIHSTPMDSVSRQSWKNKPKVSPVIHLFWSLFCSCYKKWDIKISFTRGS